MISKLDKEAHEILEEFVEETRGHENPIWGAIIACTVEFIIESQMEVVKKHESFPSKGIYSSDILEAQEKVLRKIIAGIEKNKIRLQKEEKEFFEGKKNAYN